MDAERQNFIHGSLDENGNILIPGAIRNGASEYAANVIFDEMMDFASYAFNKSTLRHMHMWDIRPHSLNIIL